MIGSLCYSISVANIWFLSIWSILVFICLLKLTNFQDGGQHGGIGKAQECADFKPREHFYISNYSYNILWLLEHYSSNILWLLEHYSCNILWLLEHYSYNILWLLEHYSYNILWLLEHYSFTILSYLAF